MPAIQKRFSNSPRDEIDQTRKYAYGACIIQDLGYYPGGNKFFSDLVHYVRSGDFVRVLLEESKTPEEYAFALGALSHYASDNNGHSLATNRAVPILYPELRKKYGDEITFDEKPSAHIKVEFGYDVVQVARGEYKSDDYHDFIGFEVSNDLLKRSFQKVYGLSITDLLQDYDTAIGTYRHTVTGLIPDATKIAWELKEDDLEKTMMTRNQFLFRMSRSEYETAYGKKYIKPGFFSKVIAFFVKILPPIGPLKILKFRTPTPEVEKLFLESFETTLRNYEKLVRSSDKQLVNLDLDTGRPANPGEYRRTDETYMKWMEQLSEKDFATVDAEIRQNILTFYSNPTALKEPEPKDRDDWQQQLQRLKATR